MIQFVGVDPGGKSAMGWCMMTVRGAPGHPRLIAGLDIFRRNRQESAMLSMEAQAIRLALDRHWAASAAGDQDAEHEIYHNDAVCEYPQSGEVIYGRRNLQALRSHHPDKPSGFDVRRIVGAGPVWVTEYAIAYEGRRACTVSIMEFRDGKVSRETQYFADPFDAPAWRAPWVGPKER